MLRREFSKIVLRAAFARAQGRCEGVLTDGDRCPCALEVGRFQYDHIVPAALTEDISLENCQVLCRPCHAAKTVVDVGIIARVRRIRDRHAGIANPHRRPLPGGKASPFKRLIGGGVIRRDTGERLDGSNRTKDL
jgi:5-methylcytosine-specific restriction protein A